MKKPKHELMTFVAGIVMLVAGLFILSQKVIVYSSFFFFLWRIIHLGNKNQLRHGCDSVDYRNCMDVHDRFFRIQSLFLHWRDC